MRRNFDSADRSEFGTLGRQDRQGIGIILAASPFAWRNWTRQTGEQTYETSESDKSYSYKGSDRTRARWTPRPDTSGESLFEPIQDILIYRTRLIPAGQAFRRDKGSYARQYVRSRRRKWKYVGRTYNPKRWYASSRYPQFALYDLL